MALVAIGVYQLVVPVHMALRTRERCVRALQIEIRAAVTECGRLKRGGVMAGGAHMRELVALMIRTGRAVVIRRVTLVALRICQIVIAAHMTIDARL